VTRPRVGISRCLLGEAVRYDGAHKRQPALIDDLAPWVEWVSVCPEVEVGMGVPREPIQLVADAHGHPAGRERVRLVGVTSGTDWTAPMDGWARARIPALGLLSGFVLKARSPSCGPDAVAVVHGRGPQTHVTSTGRGLFAQVLREILPDLPVEHEEALVDPPARQAFLARVRAYHRRLSRR
jgi:uncharacterized protein YbbK (DUF523 family)